MSVTLYDSSADVKTPVYIPAFSLLLAATVFLPRASFASDDPDFSGSYTLKAAKGEELDKGEVWTLQIAQTDAEIKIVTVIGGHPSTEVFPLTDSDANCVAADGTDGTCTAKWQGRTLVLETVYTARPVENSPDVEKHTRERLDLSSDRKTLTVRTDTKAPQFPNLTMGAPTTETYTRD